MDFDYTTETITPDTTNLLTIGGPGAFELPIGTTAQRPVAGLDNGAMRYNSDLNNIESYINSSWTPLGSGNGSVTSVGVSSNGTYANSITIGASPVTTSGTITLTPNVFTATEPGVVPLSGGGTTTFLRADGSWAAPAGGVTTFSAGSTGFTPSTPTSGVVTLAGILNPANGGTGVNTSTATNGQLLIGNGTGLSLATLTAGTAIGITNGAGSITINNTGVTSAIGTAGNITVSSATGAVTFNLATAGSPVSDQFVKITTDTFGRVTATSAVVAGDITPLINSTYVQKAGDTMTGNLVMSGGSTQVVLPNAPVAGTDAANKNYVDAAIAGLSWKQSVRAATTVNGALSTAFANGQTIDGVTLATGDRILIKNQTTQTENGIYIVQVSGAPVRSSDANTGAELVGASVYVDQGTANADSGWAQSTNAPITIGATNIVWAQFSGSGAYTAGNGLQLSGNQFSLVTPVTAVNGGTGQSTYVIGDILFANTTSTLARLADATAGRYLRSGGVSTAPLWSTTVLPNTATTGDIMVATSANTYTNLAGVATGNALISGGVGVAPLYGKIGLTTHISGILPLANGGSNANLTAVNGGIVYSTGSAMAISTAGTSGQYLQSNGAAAPTWVTLSNGGLQLYRENPSAPTTPVASGTNSIAMLSGSTASGANSYALGDGATANVANVQAFANGNFATGGDCQTLRIMARAITTNNTTTNLFIDGSAQRLVLPNNTCWTFTIRVTAQRTDASNGFAGYSFLGVITRDASAGTTNLRSSSRTIIDESNGNLNCTLSADTTNGALQINVTGRTGETFRWGATVEITQVTN